MLEFPPPCHLLPGSFGLADRAEGAEDHGLILFPATHHGVQRNWQSSQILAHDEGACAVHGIKGAKLYGVTPPRVTRLRASGSIVSGLRTGHRRLARRLCLRFLRFSHIPRLGHIPRFDHILALRESRCRGCRLAAAPGHSRDPLRLVLLLTLNASAILLRKN